MEDKDKGWVHLRPSFHGTARAGSWRLEVEECDDEELGRCPSVTDIAFGKFSIATVGAALKSSPRATTVPLDRRKWQI